MSTLIAVRLNPSLREFHQAFTSCWKISEDGADSLHAKDDCYSDCHHQARTTLALSQPGIESVGVGGDPYDAMDLWIVIGVDKIVPQVKQEIPAEMGGFPVHLQELGGPIRLL